MALPGFTAENVFQKTIGTYVKSGLWTVPALGAVKAQMVVISPDGPIGLPGQTPCEVCWHMCMTFGGANYGKCMSRCGSCSRSV